MPKPLYKITTYALGEHDYIKITQEQFEEIRNAHKLIAFGQALEEKLDLLAENYADLERELLDMAVQFSIFFGSINELLTDARHRVNRRLINLLTSVRLYHDQVAHALSSLYGKDSEPLKEFRAFSSEEYDSNLSYRVLEALRNHVQHASLPITAISFPMSAVTRDSDGTSPGAPTKFSCKVIPYIGIEELEANKDFKKIILDELKTIKNEKNDIEMVPLVRQYISCIGRIHKKLRELCKADLEAAEKIILNYREKAVKISEGLAAIEYTEENLYTDHVFLTDRPLKRWRHLQNKNSHLEQAAKNFVTSEHD